MDSHGILSQEEINALLGGGDDNSEEEMKMDLKLKLVLDFPLEVSVRIGEAKMSVGSLLNLTVGTVIELDQLLEDPVDLVVNGKVFASAEVITINETFGVRLKEIITAEDRVENLRED